MPRELAAEETGGPATRIRAMAFAQHDALYARKIGSAWHRLYVFDRDGRVRWERADVEVLGAGAETILVSKGCSTRGEVLQVLDASTGLVHAERVLGGLGKYEFPYGAVVARNLVLTAWAFKKVYPAPSEFLALAEHDLEPRWGFHADTSVTTGDAVVAVIDRRASRLTVPPSWLTAIGASARMTLFREARKMESRLWSSTSPMARSGRSTTSLAMSWS
jgi:hypothetical protein